MDDWLMLAHVLAAMAWLGSVLTLTALSLHVGRTGDADSVGRFVRSLRVIGPLVLAPAPLLVVGFGVWMVVDDDAWQFGQTWIWLALILFGVAFGIGAGFQSRAAIGAERAAAAGDADAATRQLRRWTWGSSATLVLLAVATWDMVFKPGL